MSNNQNHTNSDSQTKGFTSYSTVLLLCLFTAIFTLITSYFGYNYITKHQPKQVQVAYLDYDLVVEKAGKRIMQNGSIFVKGNPQEDAAQFALTLKKMINDYADAGFIIINKKALIEGNKTLDLTPVVIQSLGLDK